MVLSLVSITEVSTDQINNFTCTQENYKEEHHGYKEFHQKIDTFLHDKAMVYEREGLCRTHLLIDDETDQVIGFFSLHNDGIDFKRDYNKRVEKGMKEQGVYPHTEDGLNQFPSVVLHYFAIHRAFQGKVWPFNNQNYSKILIGQVFNKVIEITQSTGCMLITLEATPNSIHFYEKHGFQTFRESEIVDPYNHMLFLVKDLLD